MDQLGWSRKVLAAEVSRKLGLKVSTTTIGNWVKDIHEPTGKNRAALAAALRMPEAELLGETENVSPAPIPSTQVPLISWVTAGQFEEAMDLHAPGVADSFVYANRKVSDCAFALTVSGDSMTSPFGSKSYPHGTIIIIDPMVRATPGRRVVARKTATGEVTFKELAEDAGRMLLRPLNPQYSMIDMNEAWEIIGVVVSSHQDE